MKNVLFLVLYVHQGRYIRIHVREDFIVPVDQQINIPVQLVPTEIPQGLLMNCSAHRANLGCTAKEQVQYIYSFLPLSVTCSVFLTDNHLADSYSLEVQSRKY